MGLFGKQLSKLSNNELLPAIFNFYIEKYSFLHFCNDIFAGIKIFALLFPVLISLSIVCGESPITGLISGMAAMAVSCIFGGTKHQISSISFPVCLLTSEIIVKYQYKGLFITSFFICIILYIFGKLKVGDLLKYTTNSFLSAMYVYVAIIILISQLQFILGINTTSIFNSNFLNIMILKDNIGNITLTNLNYTIYFVGLLIMLKLIFNGYLAFFIYIILCSIFMLCSELNLFSSLGYLDIKTIGIESFTHLNSNSILRLSYTLPSQLVLSNLIIFAFGISIIIASQVSFCVSTGASITCNNKLQTNIELIATGIANFVSVSCGGIFVSSDIEMSTKNIQYCTKSIISVLSTISLLFCVYFFKDYIFCYIPMYAISSMLIILSIHVIRNANLRQYIFSKNNNKYIFWTTLSIAMYFGFVPAIFTGFVLSLFIFTHRMINIKDPIVHTNKNHDRIIKEFISNKYGYLNNQKIPKLLFNKIEIIQIDNILSINIIEKIRQVLESRGKFPKFIILYFQNIPFLDGEALRMLKEFVKDTKKKECTVILCGTNGLLLEILKKKEKESSIHNVFGYIIPNFQDAIIKILKATKSS